MPCVQRHSRCWGPGSCSRDRRPHDVAGDRGRCVQGQDLVQLEQLVSFLRSAVGRGSLTRWRQGFRSAPAAGPGLVVLAGR